MAHELTFEQIQDSKRAFDRYKITEKLDPNDDEEKIHRKSILLALLDLKFDVGQEEINDMITNMSIPEIVDFPTFLRIAAVKYKQSEFITEVELSFKAFDKDNKGFLTDEELKSILTDFGPKLSMENAEKLLNELGITKKFDFQNFVHEKI